MHAKCILKDFCVKLYKDLTMLIYRKFVTINTRKQRSKRSDLAFFCKICYLDDILFRAILERHELTSTTWTRNAVRILFFISLIDSFQLCIYCSDWFFFLVQFRFFHFLVLASPFFCSIRWCHSSWKWAFKHLSCNAFNSSKDT